MKPYKKIFKESEKFDFNQSTPMQDMNILEYMNIAMDRLDSARQDLIKGLPKVSPEASSKTKEAIEHINQAIQCLDEVL
jgi:hypothetical protein